MAIRLPEGKEKVRILNALMTHNNMPILHQRPLQEELQELRDDIREKDQLLAWHAEEMQIALAFIEDLKASLEDTSHAPGCDMNWRLIPKYRLKPRRLQQERKCNCGRASLSKKMGDYRNVGNL